jgi:hypothetical protein
MTVVARTCHGPNLLVLGSSQRIQRAVGDKGMALASQVAIVHTDRIYVKLGLEHSTISKAGG